MECNKEEAMRAKTSAEDLMRNGDFTGAQQFLIKAQGLFSGLDSLPQMLAICDVHSAAEEKINNLDNWFGILQVMHFDDDATIKKQYRKLALLLHPDKNQFPGTEAAFKLIVQANEVLADKERRLQYEIRYRYYSRLAGKQLNANSVRQRGSTNNASDTVVNNATFWTCCEHCGYRYKYLAEYVNILLYCSTCQRSFMAYDTGFDAVPPKSSTDPCNTSLHRNVESTGAQPGNVAAEVDKCKKQTVNEELNKKTQVRKTKPEDGPVKNYAHVLNPRSKFTKSEMDASKSVPAESVSRSDQAPSMRKSKRRKFVEEPCESINVDVSDTVEHIVDLKDKKRRKSQQKSNADEGSSNNHQARENPIAEDSPDPDSNRFEPTTSCFAVKQVWSLYDPTDGMPRFYARINKVVHSEFKLWITWMYPLQDNKDNSIPTACGIFQDGKSEEVTDHLIFSSQKQHLTLDNNTIIYPTRGEVWALFRGWDISWDSSLENHKPPYEYDYVEILSDFSDEDGVGVAYLGKMEGFASLFCQDTQRGVLQHQIPPSELLRFSHKAPSFKITGKGREGVPPGCFELPKYLFEVDNSRVDVPPEVEVQVKTTRNKRQNVHENDGPSSKTSGGTCTNREMNSGKKSRKRVKAVDGLKLRESPRLLNNSRVDIELERNKLNGDRFAEASEVEVQVKNTRNEHQKVHDSHGPSSKPSGGTCTNREMNSRKKSRKSVKAVDGLKLRKSPRLLNNSRVDVELERNKLNGGHFPEASEVEVQEKTTRNKHQKDHDDLGPSSKTSGGICTDREMNSQKKSRESVKAVDDLKLRKSPRLLNNSRVDVELERNKLRGGHFPETFEVEVQVKTTGNKRQKVNDNHGPSSKTSGGTCTNREMNSRKKSRKSVKAVDDLKLRKSSRLLNITKKEATLTSSPETAEKKMANSGESHRQPDELNGDVNFSVPETHVPSSCTAGHENTLNFENQRSWDKFQVNQVWAIYSNANGMPRTYAQIKKIDTSPEFKLHVAPLELHRPPKIMTRPACCGCFKLKTGKADVLAPSSFSHQVKAVKTKVNRFEIYPGKNDIWALYKNWNAIDGSETEEVEIVEVVETDGQNIQAVPLTAKGRSNKLLYRRSEESETGFVDIPKTELSRFSHQIPAFKHKKRATRFGDGGCWELDLKAVPVL